MYYIYELTSLCRTLLVRFSLEDTYKNCLPLPTVWYTVCTGTRIKNKICYLLSSKELLWKITSGAWYWNLPFSQHTPTFCPSVQLCSTHHIIHQIVLCIIKSRLCGLSTVLIFLHKCFHEQLFNKTLHFA